LFVVLIVALPVLSATEVLFIFAGCNTVCALITLPAVDVHPRWVSPAGAVRLYRLHLSNGIYALVTTVYGRLDTVMLALFGAVAAAGIYGTYYRIVLVAVGLIGWITSLAWRSLAEPDLMQARLIWLEKRLAGMAVAASLVLVVLGPWVLRKVTHGGSLPLATFVLLGLIPVPTVMCAPLGSAMILSFRSRRLARISTCVLGVACCFYLVLIPLLGSTGAALGSLAVETLALVWMWREVFARGTTGVQKGDEALVEGGGREGQNGRHADETEDCSSILDRR
jgi:O-antigen/teichoic acid export membrane protein